MGITQETADAIDGWVMLICIVICVLLIHAIMRRVVIRFIHWIVRRSKFTWDDILFDDKVLTRLGNILMPIIFKIALPSIIFSLNITGKWLRSALYSAVDIWTVLAVLAFLYALLRVFYEFMEQRPGIQGKPIRGLLQTAQVILLLIALILIISIIINKSPMLLLTGLGASAAVVSLIFKNSILGLVSGVMLSQEHMIKVGDWVEMPSHGIEGIVEEVTLNTVKIRNFDNSLSTVPPYVLTDNHLINQQAMKESGGRRVMRSLLLDVRSIRFCTPEELASLSDIPAVAQHIATLSTSRSEVANITLFRAYLSDYIEKMPLRHKGMLSMVRELAPTQYGLPLQIYLFLAQTEWRAFELAQADIIDHIVAIIPRFGLKIFQLSIEGAEGEG